MRTPAFAATVALILPLLAAAPASAEKVSTEEFVNKAAVGSMFEVQSGKLAADKAENEDVKEFGEQMVDDHSEANDALKELVEENDIKVKLPTSLDEKQKADLDKLKDVSGAKFDETYVPMQVLAHEGAVNLFEDYSKSGDNDALKTWASDTLPTLKEHLDEVRTLNKELSKPAKTAEADTKPMDDDKKSMDDKKAMNDEADMKAADKKKTDEMAAKSESKEPVSKPAFNYVTEQKSTDWSAQALIGRAVVNTKGETVGDINNVILNEKGKVVAVTIGVGGLLGLGEKDVGVPFDALKFSDEEPMEKKTGSDEKAEADDADHDEEVIVLDATKEQLEAAPEFVWLGEKREKRAEAENETTVE